MKNIVTILAEERAKLREHSDDDDSNYVAPPKGKSAKYVEGWKAVRSWDSKGITNIIARIKKSGPKGDYEQGIADALKAK